MTSSDHTPVRVMHKGKELVVYWDSAGIKSRTIRPTPPRGTWMVSWGGHDVTPEVKRTGIVERDDLLRRAQEVL